MALEDLKYNLEVLDYFIMHEHICLILGLKAQGLYYINILLKLQKKIIK